MDNSTRSTNVDINADPPAMSSSRTVSSVQHSQHEPHEGLRFNHPFHMWDAIMETPDAVRRCLAPEASGRALAAGRALRDKSIKRVFLLGCGTSLYAAISTAHALRSLAGLDADAYDSLEFVNYRLSSHCLGAEAGRTGVIAFSHSGNTRATVDAARAARSRGILTICLTDVPDSLLAREADVFVPVGGGKEPVEPKTRSYINTTVVGHLVAIGAGSGSFRHLAEAANTVSERIDPVTGYMPSNFGFRDHATRAARSSSQVQPRTSERAMLVDQLQIIPALLEDCRSLENSMKALARKYRDVKRVFAVGGGPNYASALEIALKFKEAVLVAGEGLEIEEAFHGPIASLNKETLVIAVSATGPSYERVGEFVRAASMMGCPVVNVTSQPNEAASRSYSQTGEMSLGFHGSERHGDKGHVSDDDAPGSVDTVLVNPAGLPETFGSAVMVYPLYMLAYYSALARGNNPDVFRLGDEAFHKAMAAIPSVSYEAGK